MPANTTAGFMAGRKNETITSPDQSEALGHETFYGRYEEPDGSLRYGESRAGLAPPDDHPNRPAV